MDAEAYRERITKGERQTFRCAVAVIDTQPRKGRPYRPPDWGQFLSPEALWAWVGDRTDEHRRTVVVAHNLGYDLRVTAALDILPAQGWQLELIRLDGGQAWAQWRRDGASLAMLDSMSWFGVGLDKVAALVDLPKVPLPADSDSDEAWLARCRRDVEALRRAWLLVVDWIDRNELGNFKVTGAGMAWANFRHVHMRERVLHHGMERISKVEREAAWTGRCEAWRHGVLRGGPFTEWDIRCAYANVAESTDVPVRLRSHLGAAACRRALGGVEGTAVLIRADIATGVPLLPHRHDRGVYWPVGQFRGWWWDIELRAAARAGARVVPLEGWAYATAPLLRPWATWVLDELDKPASEVHPVLALVVKQWSRSLVGRFGARWSEWADYGEAAPGGVHLAYMSAPDPTITKRMVSVGGKTMVEGEPHDAPDSAVHVMSYVMAECRVRLWQVMVAAGLDELVYVDTDAVIVTPRGSERLEQAAVPNLRVKARWQSLEVLGPRQLVTDGRLKAAGVPSSATRVGERTWAGEVWRSLPVSIGAGELREVKVLDREWTLRGVDHRRAHLEDGRTAPFVATSGATEAPDGSSPRPVAI